MVAMSDRDGAAQTQAASLRDEQSIKNSRLQQPSCSQRAQVTIDGAEISWNLVHPVCASTGQHPPLTYDRISSNVFSGMPQFMPSRRQPGMHK